MRIKIIKSSHCLTMLYSILPLDSSGQSGLFLHCVFCNFWLHPPLFPAQSQTCGHLCNAAPISNVVLNSQSILQGCS